MPSAPFIKRTGAVEAVAAVSEGEMRFTDINEAVTVSSATLSNRLKEGKVEDLWEERLVPDPESDGRSRREYVMKRRGRELAEAIEDTDVLELIERRAELKAEIERTLDEIGGVEEI